MEPNNHHVKNTVKDVSRVTFPYMTCRLANGGKGAVKVIEKMENTEGKKLKIPGLYPVKDSDYWTKKSFY